ncbi:Kynureninase 2, partial [Clarias magur]
MCRVQGEGGCRWRSMPDEWKLMQVEAEWKEAKVLVRGGQQSHFSRVLTGSFGFEGSEFA